MAKTALPRREGMQRSLGATGLPVGPLKLWIAFAALSNMPLAGGLHHMKAASFPIKATDGDSDVPMVVTNKCTEDIYPGVITQAGGGPENAGFKLAPGESNNMTVSADWQGRIWGRTNCTFNSDGSGPSTSGGIDGSGRACGTGDCNGVLNCSVTGNTPVTLAEFTLHGSDDQTFYDISLVDGYNLPMAIVMNPRGNATLEDIPPNLTNPSCQGTADLLAPADYNPYSMASSSQQFLGTNSSFPLPFVGDSVTNQQVSRWCPWPLQVNPPSKPGDGVYPYPDDNIQRPSFNPCFSACAKWNKPQDCCTGDYDDPKKCKASDYSKAAKAVCPDAYSFAYDDHSSTFIIPMGAGFEVVFCPGARSTNILAKKAAADQLLQQNAHPASLNLTDLPSGADKGLKIHGQPSSVLALAVATWAIACWLF